jgi:hypothetical protein
LFAKKTKQQRKTKMILKFLASSNHRRHLINVSILLLILIIVKNVANTNVETLLEPTSYLINKLNLRSLGIDHVTNIRYNDGHVYVGAKNCLLKIDSNSLEIVQRVEYGPLSDSVMCRYNPREECSSSSDPFSIYNSRWQQQGNENLKIQTDNYNKILIVYKEKNALLSCWSARQGVCDLRDLNDLNIIIKNSTEPVVANDFANSTVGFIASSPNSQPVFYVATTYTSQGPYRSEIPALSGRSLSITAQKYSSSNSFMEVLTSKQGLKSRKAAVEFMARYTSSHIVKYVDGFNLGNHNFFLSVQSSKSQADNNGRRRPVSTTNRFITKLARFCLNDLSFIKSYIEIPIECVGVVNNEKIVYNELISAKLLKTNSGNSFNYHLVGLFQLTNRDSFNQSINDDNSNKQAVCLYPLKSLQSKIRDNLQACYFGDPFRSKNKPLSRGLDHIKPWQPCINSQSFDTHILDDDNCFTTDNGLFPIGGEKAAVSAAILQPDSSIQFDSLQIKSDSTTLILFSNRQKQLSFYNLKVSPVEQATQFKIIKLQQNVNSDDGLTSPVSNLEVVNDSLFVVSDDDIIYNIKTSNCDSYSTCQTCFEGMDPLCGWCASSNQCTTMSKCVDTTKWTGLLSRNQNVDSICTDIVAIRPSIAYLTTKWIEVIFQNSLSFSPFQLANSSTLLSTSTPQLEVTTINKQPQCVFYNYNSNLELFTDAVQINSNRLKCPLPHISQLYNLINEIHSKTVINTKNQNNDFQLSDDKIFSDNLNVKKYPYGVYYEDKLDKLDLNIFIRKNKQNYGLVSSSSSSPSTLDLIQVKTKFNLTLVNCDAFKSCVSCLLNSKSSGNEDSDNESACSWCSGRCVDKTAEKRNEKCENLQYCPSFVTGTNRLLIPFTQYRKQAPLPLQWLNYNTTHQSNSNLKCLLTIFNGRPFYLNNQRLNVTVPLVSLNSTHAHCNLVDVFNSIDTMNDQFLSINGKIQTNLRIYDSSNDIYIDSSSSGKLSLLFYKCERLALSAVNKDNDCSDCLALNPQFSCMWCKNPLDSSQISCSFMNTNNKKIIETQCVSPYFTSSIVDPLMSQSCNRPQITSIHPTKFTQSGGVRLEINGINFGHETNNILRITVICPDNPSDVKLCTKATLITPKKIVCIMERSELGGHKCQLVVDMKDILKTNNGTVQLKSKPEISIVAPRIINIEPAKIIQSARGVWLRIQGVDLDVAAESKLNYQVKLAEPDLSADYLITTTSLSNQLFVDCKVLNVSATEIDCRLSDNFQNTGHKDVHLLIGNYHRSIQSSLIYVSVNPVITSIKPFNQNFESDSTSSSSSTSHLVTVASGGTKFEITGYNFDLAQSVYTFVTYRGQWYSEPSQALSQDRSSNSIQFEWPALGSSFYQQTTTLMRNQQQTRPSSFDIYNIYELEVGFQMDGFKWTSTSTDHRSVDSIVYIPDFNETQIRVENYKLTIEPSTSIKEEKEEEASYYYLTVSLYIDQSVVKWFHNSFSGRYSFRSDFQVFVGCSLCDNIIWLNNTQIRCRLPFINIKQLINTTIDGNDEKTADFGSACRNDKRFNLMLSQLNSETNPTFDLIHLFIGYNHISSSLIDNNNDENLNLYKNAYITLNVDKFATTFLEKLLSRVQRTTKNSKLIDYLTSQHHIAVSKSSNSEFIKDINATNDSSANQLIMIGSLIATIAIVIVIFTLILATIVMRMRKIKNEEKLFIDATTTSGFSCNTMMKPIANSQLTTIKDRKYLSLPLRQTNQLMIQQSHNLKSLCLNYKIINTDDHKLTKNEMKQFKKEATKFQLKLAQKRNELESLELSVRPLCVYQFQLLHSDYMSQLQHDLIYITGLPLNDYTVYLKQCLFSTPSKSLNSNFKNKNVYGKIQMKCSGRQQQQTILMTTSSMSNSTTNTLISNNSPLQRQLLVIILRIFKVLIIKIKFFL